MDIHLLGTGGADGIPALFSGSRVSVHARNAGGKDVRSRASALVDGHIKLDFGPDTWHQVTREGLDPREWTSILFTHSDPDHLALEELQYALFPFNESEFSEFTIFGNEVIERKVFERYPNWPFEFVRTKMFCPLKHAEYTITPLMARHMQYEEAHNYLVSDGEKTLLYGTDTGVWQDPTWEYLADHRVDCLVLECSEGFVLTPYNGHLDIDEFRYMVNRLRKLGVIDDTTTILTTHHSHNGDATHDELCRELEPHGVTIGYDGLKVEF